jgi:flagellar motor switch protein FliN
MTESMQEALLQLGLALAEAALGPLQDAAGDDVEIDGVEPLLEYPALAELVRPGTVVADASSVDGAVGRSLLTADPATARILIDGPAAGEPALEAAAPDADSPPAPAPPDEDAPALTAAELSSLATLADSLNASATDALGGLIGQRVRYDEAHASVVEDPRFVVRPGPVQAICTTFTKGGRAWQLIRFVPNALVMRAAHAFENLTQDSARPAGEAGAGPSPQALGTMRLRVCAELGRTEVELADALALPLGAVVELEQDAEAPIDLMVNGMRYGTGRLIVTDDGEWAVALDEISPAGVDRVAAG